MHSGCPESQASKWLRHIESRLPKLRETLATALNEAPSIPNKPVAPSLPNHDEKFPGELHPFLDPATWEDFDFATGAKEWETDRKRGVEYLVRFETEQLSDGEEDNSEDGSSEDVAGVPQEDGFSLERSHVRQWPSRLVAKGIAKQFLISLT